MNILGVTAAGLGFVAVALGAFGAHGLEGKLDETSLGWWQTATMYGLIHAVAALAIAGQDERLRAGGWAFVAGTTIFSGTLYAMALGAPRILGAITPVGGVLYLFGWGLCGWTYMRR